MINMSSDRLQSAYQSHRVTIADWILDREQSHVGKNESSSQLQRTISNE